MIAYIFLALLPMLCGFAIGYEWRRTQVQGWEIQRELDEQADRLGHPEWKERR
jgi:hypothetical protein